MIDTEIFVVISVEFLKVLAWLCSVFFTFKFLCVAVLYDGRSLPTISAASPFSVFPVGLALPLLVRHNLMALFIALRIFIAI